MHFTTLLDIASVLGIAIFIFGFRGVMMIAGMVIGAISGVGYALFRLVRWMRP
jgi:hypothetical protein